MTSPENRHIRRPSLLKMFSAPIATLEMVRQTERGLAPIIALLAFEWVLLEPSQVVEHTYRLLDNPLSGALVAWNGFVRFSLGPATCMLAGGVIIYYLSRHRGQSVPKLWGSICAWGYAWAFHTATMAIAASTRLLGVDEPFMWIRRAYEIEPLVGLFIEGLPILIPMGLAFGRATKTPESAESLAPIPLPRLALICAVGLSALSGTAQHMEKIQGQAKPLVSQEHLPSFPLHSIDGQTSLSSEDLQGKVVLIDVWATWCGPCVATMPYMQDLYSELKDTDFELISLNVESHNRPAVERFIAEHGLSFPVFVDSGTAQRALRVRMFPTTILVNRDGLIHRVDVGITSVAGLRGEIDALLEKR